MESLYDVLEARPEDDAESLKKAYHKAVKANHPDYNSGDPVAAMRFSRIVAAYDILRDRERRAAYDRRLESRRAAHDRGSKSGPGPLLSKAERASARPLHQFGSNAIVVLVVVGIALATSGDDIGGMTARQLPEIIAEQVQERAAPVLSQDAICKRDAAQLAHLRVSQERSEIIQFETELGCEKLRSQVARLRESVDSAVEDSAVLKAARGPDVEQHQNAEHPQVTERAPAVLSEEETCQRDAARLAHLRISQERNAVIQFESELSCERLRLQVARLRESIDPP